MGARSGGVGRSNDETDCFRDKALAGMREKPAVHNRANAVIGKTARVGGVVV